MKFCIALLLALAPFACGDAASVTTLRVGNFNAAVVPLGGALLTDEGNNLVSDAGERLTGEPIEIY